MQPGWRISIRRGPAGISRVAQGKDNVGCLRPAGGLIPPASIYLILRVKGKLAL